ncbi:MAG: S8 family serine peptidase [Polyangiales bacterium]
MPKYLGCRDVLIAGLLAQLAAGGGAAAPQPRVAGPAAVHEAAARSDVIVALRVPDALGPAGQHERAQLIASLDAAVLARVGGDDVRLGRRYKHTPAFSASVTHAGLERLQRDPDVASVQPDATGRGQMMRALSATRADQVQRDYGLTGRGINIAILDTGIDREHPDLKDAVLAEHCFTSGGCPPRNRDEGESAQDDHGHGTAVAGVAVSRGQVTVPGFAPEASLIAIKVQGQDNTGRESDWVAGLDWIYDNLPRLRVNVVNLSVASELLFGVDDCDANHESLRAAVGNLVNAGVAVFAASGNDGSATQLSAPACVTGVIAVGASYAEGDGPQPPGAGTFAAAQGPRFAECRDDATTLDHIACFSNRNARLDLVAPGAALTTDARGGGQADGWGTSLASAAVSGIAALLLECAPSLRVADLRTVLLTSGRPTSDPTGGRSIPAVDALAALRATCQRAATPPPDAGVAPEAQAGSGVAAGSGAPPAAGTAGMGAGPGPGGGTGAAAGGAGSLPSAGGSAPGTTAGANTPVAGSHAAGASAVPAANGGAFAATPVAGSGSVPLSGAGGAAMAPSDPVDFPDPMVVRGSLDPKEPEHSGCHIATPPGVHERTRGSGAVTLLALTVLVLITRRTRGRLKSRVA